MKKFLSGTIIENEAGATYENMIYDRFLKIRLLQDLVLPVFDADAIAGNLHIGQQYEMLLIPLTLELSMHTEWQPLQFSTDWWQGEIMCSTWRADQGVYTYTHSQLYDHDWVLVETPLGCVLLSPKDLERSQGKGQILKWRSIRMDMYAVLE